MIAEMFLPPSVPVDALSGQTRPVAAADGGLLLPTPETPVVLWTGDCRDGLARLPDQCVQAVVCSPPYYNQRDYSTEGGLWADGWRGELGRETSVSAYVAHLVEIFTAVHRVLRNDGVLWLNLGDSYSNAGKWGGWTGGKHVTALHGQSGIGRPTHKPAYTGTPLPDGSLLGVPWRVAFALQDAGWILRSEVIWAKRNPMPESVKNRPTKSHEQIFLFSKQGGYYYDADAVREPSTGQTGSAANFQRANAKYAESPVPGELHGQHRTDRLPTVDTGGRNQRDVWELAGENYEGEHYAAFPTAIPRRVILASTSAHGACPTCGTAYRRVTERTLMQIRPGPKAGSYGSATTDGLSGTMLAPASSVTVGWAPGCTCPPADPRPCIVLDPFSGSGTTAAVASSLGRWALGLDLQPAYTALAQARVAAATPWQQPAVQVPEDHADLPLFAGLGL